MSAPCFDKAGGRATAAALHVVIPPPLEAQKQCNKYKKNVQGVYQQGQRIPREKNHRPHRHHRLFVRNILFLSVWSRTQGPVWSVVKIFNSREVCAGPAITFLRRPLFKLRISVTIQSPAGDSENRRNEGAFSPEMSRLGAKGGGRPLC
jgi:hypothetical protein